MRYEIYSGDSFSPLKISSMGFSKDPLVTSLGPVRRNLYIVHYVLKGKGYYNGNPVCEGQGFLTYPGYNEEYHPDPDEPWEILWITSFDSAMKNIFHRYHAEKDTLIFHFDSIPTAKNIASKIISQNHEITDPLKTLEMFLEMLNSHTYMQNTKQHKAAHEAYLDFCVNYITNNIHKKITVNELSSLVGISQPYLYKIFKNKFGVSTKEYILYSKIKLAKTLLIETDMLITEIANSVGYNDILVFSKAFSAKEKISPQKFRVMRKKT